MRVAKSLFGRAWSLGWVERATVISFFVSAGLAVVVVALALLRGTGLWGNAWLVAIVVTGVFALAALLRFRRRQRAYLANPQNVRPRDAMTTASLARIVSAHSAEKYSRALTVGVQQRLSQLPSDIIARRLLLTDSPVMWDAVARSATSGRFDWAELTSLLRGGGGIGLMLEPAASATIVRALVARQRDLPLAERVLAETRWAGWGAPHERAQLASLAAFLGSDVAGELAAILPDSWHRAQLEVELLHPHDDARRGSAWFAAFASMFTAFGFVAPALRDPANPRFDGLTAGSDADGEGARAPDAAGGPLVSVILTSYRPTGFLRTAVRSVLEQTHRHLELIVVDDASGSDFAEVYDEIEKQDPRVRVLHLAENGGTYRARNAALADVRGEYVTFHDSDDWSHPERIAVQLEWLTGQPSSVGCVTASARVSDDLRLAQPAGLDLRLCEPSLMLSREVLSRVGGFDTVRRGADVEYRERIHAVTGRPVDLLPVAVPLVLMHFDRQSLSGGDFADGWEHPARTAYHSAHRWWRSRGMPGRDRLVLGTPAEDARLFRADARLTGAPASTHRLDTLIVGDLRGGSSGRAVRAEIQRALRSGSPTGLLHRASHRGDFAGAFDSRIQTMLETGALVLVMPEDDVTAESVVVTSGEGFLDALAALRGITFSSLIVRPARNDSISTKDLDAIRRHYLGARFPATGAAVSAP